MKDRIVEHPNRFRLVPVSGESGVYDIEVVPGIVTEAGTPINKASLLSDTTAALFTNTDNPSVDKILGIIGYAKPPSTLYCDDYWLYIAGQHPVLCNNPYSDYKSYHARNISIDGNAQTIVVYDN